MLAQEIERFHDYYTANGWRVGKSAMKDWKAALRNWKRNAREYGHSSGNNGHKPTQLLETDEVMALHKYEEQLLELQRGGRR